MINNTRFDALLAQVDKLNSQDPNQLIEAGKPVASEVLYSQRMQQRLSVFAPEANEELQIAAYCQHIQRWTIARKDYPMDRPGYKRWRTDLAKFHAQTTASLMVKLGYQEDAVERVKYLLQKKGLKRDSDTQALEDVICLVFMEYYLEEFASKHADDKIISIIQKTWKKMSEKGHKAALALSLKPHLSTLVTKALS